MKKINLLLILCISVCGNVWSQTASVKLDLPANVTKEIGRDCPADILEAFLSTGNKPVSSIAGYQLNQVACADYGVSLTYKKSDRELLVGIDDFRPASMQDELIKSLRETLFKMTKANVDILEIGFSTFEKLKKEQPKTAASLEKTTPGPSKITLPTGDALYVVRNPCEEDDCGKVEAKAMVRGERYYFSAYVSHDPAKRNQQAAENFIKEITQTIKWDKLK